MQTSLAKFIRDTPEGHEADAILRSCVHCGFCTATCPTYQLLGDELDSPRGRIYLIKQLLEGAPASRKTLLHLDRCLTCRACETTCPSGVQYGQLLGIGRSVVEKQIGRPFYERSLRWLLCNVIAYRKRLRIALRIGHLFRPVLPMNLRNKLAPLPIKTPWPKSKHNRNILILEGCALPDTSPNTNAATARILDRLGISLIAPDNAGCCGAISHHLSQADGLDFMRRNIDAWWPLLEAGAEAIVITASGCGSQVKEYGTLLRHDQDYADKASRVSALAKDISEILRDEELSALNSQSNTRVAFQSPCSLQHGQKLDGTVESILTQAGFTLTEVPDAHLCCGSAGTYSLLQPKISGQLRKNKLKALHSGQPDIIATANIGCQLHLNPASNIEVKHWIELLDEATQGEV